MPRFWFGTFPREKRIKGFCFFLSLHNAILLLQSPWKWKSTALHKNSASKYFFALWKKDNLRVIFWEFSFVVDEQLEMKGMAVTSFCQSPLVCLVRLISKISSFLFISIQNKRLADSFTVESVAWDIQQVLSRITIGDSRSRCWQWHYCSWSSCWYCWSPGSVSLKFTRLELYIYRIDNR